MLNHCCIVALFVKNKYTTIPFTQENNRQLCHPHYWTTFHNKPHVVRLSYTSCTNIPCFVCSQTHCTHANVYEVNIRCQVVWLIVPACVLCIESTCVRKACVLAHNAPFFATTNASSTYALCSKLVILSEPPFIPTVDKEPQWVKMQRPSLLVGAGSQTKQARHGRLHTIPSVGPAPQPHVVYEPSMNKNYRFNE